MNFKKNFKKIAFKSYFYLIFLFYLLLSILVYSSCSSSYKYYRDYEYIKNFYSIKIISNPVEKKIDDEQILQIRIKIVELANKSIGLTSFIAKSRSFLYDCSGFIFYLYYKAGIDLTSYIVDQTPYGGVHQLYLIAKNYFSVSEISFNIADIIIFDNTYDRNKNGKDDDFFTHVAIITEIKDDGTIVFIHKSNSGVQKGYMNLLKNDLHKVGDEIINSYMKESDDKAIASYLFNTFATFFR
ncbi:MAG TPA: NlpC/P60 family protein [Exilispira sp.]|nr:NlpC/P60 family protein [Exilispira sp.]